MNQERAERVALAIIANGHCHEEWDDIGGPENGPIIVGGQWIMLGRRLLLGWSRANGLTLEILQRADPKDPYGHNWEPSLQKINNPAILAAFRERMADVEPRLTNI